MSTDASLIRADRFAEIGAIIERDAGILIERWRRRALQEQPQARRVHEQVLLDDLPGFLIELGRALAESVDPEHAPHARPAALHGQQRWQTGWSLTEMIRDYQILRLVILDYLDDALDRSLRLREVMAVGLALDEAISVSVERFMQFCEEDQQNQTKSLLDADRRKNEFLATLAHEMRNPLAPLRNALDVMRLKASDPATLDQLREIMDRQVRQMTRLMDDLLDMSRIALGKLVLRRERLDLVAVAREAIEMIRPQAEARRQELTVALPGEPLWIEGDSTRLVQVFANLLSNAGKFTPEGGAISLVVAVEAGRAVVRVRDNGVGIPSEMLGRIFDLFTQVESPGGGESAGLGIGLSLVRRLVELHGGSVGAHSGGLQLGSEFTVLLPLLPAAQSSATPISDSRKATASQRILVVEDNADGLKSLCLLLKLLGHEVLSAADGAQGVAAATEGCPSVALIDIGLPDFDGYEVARRIRLARGEATFLVALTGFSQPEDRQRAKDAGFGAHLTKPVELPVLQALLAARAPRQSSSAPA